MSGRYEYRNEMWEEWINDTQEETELELCDVAERLNELFEENEMLKAALAEVRDTCEGKGWMRQVARLACNGNDFRKMSFE